MPEAYYAARDAALAEQEEYLEDLWFLLHHSEDDDTFVLGLTSYLDDSGGDDRSHLVTCGGVLMSRIQFKAFSDRWAKMYDKCQYAGYTLEQPLHMVDFSPPHGKYSGLYPELKRNFFLWLFPKMISNPNSPKMFAEI